MAATTLEIRDGNPWWLSTDIWVVPGDDPTGPPGSPVGGQTADVWATVTNQGPADVTDARVDFVWADPSLQVARSTAHPIGSGYVTVAAGQSMDVLCLTPWLPVVVNDGHECLVAVVVSSADPLPSPLPDAYDPPTYHQVAQRNLTVLASGGQMRVLTLTLVAGARVAKSAHVRIEERQSLDRDMVEHLGLSHLEPARAGTVRATLAVGPALCPDPAAEAKGHRELDVRVPAGTRTPLRLAIDSRRLQRGQYEAVHVVEYDGDRETGGIMFVVTHARDTSPSRTGEGREQS
ncbi:hypothetical protein ACFUC1_17245 [Pedococcus sp. NPDC057267]|uniref:hypothetical protein n=1 Tax=Pedococcus sp. NPDC057267 TaxID=3346077 RepID=UPI0036340BD2